MRLRSSAVALLWVVSHGVFCTEVLGADVIHVPSDYGTIQGAIDASEEGDEVVVDSGWYAEAIDFLGKAITVRSVSGRVTTKIDATGLETSVVTCANGEGLDTVLDGFTLVGGAGTDTEEGVHGGGMYNFESSPTVLNCTFTETHSLVTHGGGVYNETSSPWFENCIFFRTGAIVVGGGMCNIESSPTLIECTFEESAAKRGGGMYNRSSSPVIRDCAFNRSLGGVETQGGGMYNEIDSSPEIVDSVFRENNAEDGAGLYTAGNSSLMMTGCSFIDNFCRGYGGGMYLDEAPTAILTDCSFESNSAVADDPYHGGGGAVFVSDAAPQFEGCTFTGNRSTAGGGAIFLYFESDVTITECTFTQNAAEGGLIEFGGALMMYGFCNATAVDSLFDGNTAGAFGGAIYLGGDELDIEGCRFVGNEAGRSGGAICVNEYANVWMNLNRSQFVGNNAVDFGGAFYNYATIIGPITNCIFEGNEAGSGGAIYSFDDRWQLTNCTLVGNSADEGGALYNYLSETTPVIANCVFADNTAAESGDHMLNYGGAMPQVGYSSIQGCGGSGGSWDTSLGTDLGGNVDSDPMFVDSDAGDFRLRSGSACLDAGANQYLPKSVTADFGGRGRFVDDPFITDTGMGESPMVDMGAHEFQAEVGPVLSILPEPLVAGAEAVLFVNNARFETETCLVYSLSGPGRTFVPAINVALDLANPRRFDGSKFTDGNGSAGYLLQVPEKARGLAIWFQVVQQNLKTGVVATRIE